MTINKDDYYLKNIELCKKLEPIMKKKGIDEDSYIIIPPLTGVGAQSVTHQLKARAASAHLFKGTRDLLRKYKESRSYEVIPTWIKPSLEAALPEWCFEPDWYKLEHTIRGISIKELDSLLPHEKERHKYKETKILTEEGIEVKQVLTEAFIGQISRAILDYRKIYSLTRGQHSLECLAQLIVLLDEKEVE